MSLRIQVRRPSTKKDIAHTKESRGKWTPNYEGWYIVKNIFLGGTLILSMMDGEEFPRPVNFDT